MLRVEVVNTLSNEIRYLVANSLEEATALIEEYNFEKGDNFFASLCAE